MRKVLIAVAAFVIAIAAAALPAGAGTVMGLEFEVTPTSGEAGTLVTFDAVDPCPINTGAVPNAPGDLSVGVSRMAEPASPSDFVADDPLAGDGSWGVVYNIPDSEPVGDITFYAFCLYETSPPEDVEAAAVPDEFRIFAEYAPVTFSVTAPPPSSTTTTTSTSTTTSTTIPKPTITATPTSVFQGDTVAVNATGFAPNSNVVITLESDPVNLGTFVADSAGRIAANVVVPADFPTGAHTLKLTGTDIAGAVLVLSTGITVASRIQVATTAAPVATTTSLPQTGSSITEPALIVGAGLILLGAVAVLAARRRRSATR